MHRRYDKQKKILCSISFVAIVSEICFRDRTTLGSEGSALYVDLSHPIDPQIPLLVKGRLRRGKIKDVFPSFHRPPVVLLFLITPIFGGANMEDMWTGFARDRVL